jgi:S1-C subfamily serine protease
MSKYYKLRPVVLKDPLKRVLPTVVPILIAPRRGSVFPAAWVLAVIFVLFLTSDLAAKSDIRDAMVKIYSVQIEPYYYDPWSMNRQTFTSGSGCVIEGGRIITNAHIVSDQSFLQVRRHGDAKKHTARVVAVSHAADLALLTVDDPAFFASVTPLQIGALPEVQQEVAVYGFPEGGDTLSITKGVVSRIEHDAYAHSSIALLAVQIDAAINSGNSGGPVVVGHHLSGVVMQYLQDSENIGYMVPTPVIQHFLTDISDGRHDGIPEDGIIVQDMENDSLKKRYRLGQNRSGILVVSVLPGAPAQGIVKPGDVILAVDGNDVADDGTIEFRPRERTRAAYHTQLHQLGEKLRLDILREHSEKTVSLTLDRAVGTLDLVAKERYDVRPTYFIYGGLIFIPLTQNYLMSWGDDWYNSAPKNLVALYKFGRSTVQGEEAVILSKVLPAEVNSGYHNNRDLRIVAVNNRKIFNLRQLMRAVEAPAQDPFIEFKTDQGIKIVLNRKRVAAAQSAILKTYSVPSDRSEDLRKSLSMAGSP